MEIDHSSVFSARGGGGGSVAAPDRYVFGPPGSRSGYISQRYGSGSGSFVEKTIFVIQSLQSIYGGDKSTWKHHYNYIHQLCPLAKCSGFAEFCNFLIKKRVAAIYLDAGFGSALTSDPGVFCE
jgi:hypothetical protein